MTLKYLYFLHSTIFPHCIKSIPPFPRSLDTPHHTHIPILPFPLPRSTEIQDDYLMAFEFNSDVECRFSLLLSLPDTTGLASLRQGPGSGVKSSRHYSFPEGSEQKFVSEGFPLQLGVMSEEELGYSPESGQDAFPLAILMETENCEFSLWHREETFLLFTLSWAKS